MPSLDGFAAAIVTAIREESSSGTEKTKNPFRLESGNGFPGLRAKPARRGSYSEAAAQGFRWAAGIPPGRLLRWSWPWRRPRERAGRQNGAVVPSDSEPLGIGRTWRDRSALESTNVGISVTLSFNYARAPRRELRRCVSTFLLPRRLDGNFPRQVPRPKSAPYEPLSLPDAQARPSCSDERTGPYCRSKPVSASPIP